MSKQSKLFSRLLLAALAFTLCASPSSALAQTVDGDKVMLSWMPNPPGDNITGYELHYDLKSGPPYAGIFADQGPSPIRIPVESLDNPQDPTYELSGIPPCATIFLALKAYNAEASSDFTEEISGTVAFKPQDVRAFAVSDRAVHVSWESPPPGYVEKITRYLVYYDMAPAAMTSVDLGYRYMVEVLPDQLENAAKPNMLLESLLPDMRINVAVAATCVSGENDLSDPATAQTPKEGEEPPEPPPEASYFDRDTDLTGGCNVAANPSGSWALLLLLGALYLRRRR